MAEEAIVIRHAKRRRVLVDFFIDAADAALVDRYQYWYATDAGYVYAMQETGRFVWLTSVLLAKRPGFVIDHVDRQPLNNRRGNLRYVTHADNMANTAVRRHSKSGVKGVRFHVQSGLWEARISVDRKGIGLGYFHALGEAAAAFQIAHRYYHPDLYAGVDALFTVFGFAPFWINRAARRNRDGRGRYVTEGFTYAD